MLHAEHARELLSSNVPEDVLVIDLTCRRFISTRVVTNLEVSHFRVSRIDVGNDVALLDLLVIHVEQDLAGGAIDRAADFKPLGDLGEIQARVVSEVERLQHHD